MVLGMSVGIVERKKDAMMAMTFACLVPRDCVKILLTRKKKAMTVRANMATGKRAADWVTEVEPNMEAREWNQAIM